MEKCLLSIDWDYFIKTPNQKWSSQLESKKTAVDLWYKLYFQASNRGRNIQQFFELAQEATKFWDKLGTIFQLKEGITAYVSDSHALSFKIAKDKGLNVVYLFDSHADLGYGGLSSLNFEVNCANWLGKLLKEGLVKEANIIYGPYTAEKPEFFKEINQTYNVRYLTLEQLGGRAITVEAVHICRSGAWTPPWYDNQFVDFVKRSGLGYRFINCPSRKWNPNNLSFAEQIDYLLA